jgi:hypothetical protein
MNRIRFEAVEPDFETRGTGFYRATVEGKPIRAGITNEAWIHLVPRVARLQNLLIADLRHPAHQIAQALIQKKFDEAGLDGGGAVVVTLADALVRSRDGP